MKHRALATLAATALALPAAAGDYQHSLAVYFMGVGMDGTTAVGDVEADVNVAFSDILENLEFGGMLAYRVERGKWAVTADALFMGLGATKEAPGGFLAADVDLDQWMFELDGAYETTERLELLFGLRYNSIEAAVAVTPELGSVLTAEGREDWIDPVLGARWTQPIGARWAFVGRADIGGFGVGADFAWQAVARFDWKFSGNVGASFGYRALDADYENGEGADRFVYDVLAAGPLAALIFSF